jgi:uncharacterized protein (TIGR00255 family)
MTSNQNSGNESTGVGRRTSPGEEPAAGRARRTVRSMTGYAHRSEDTPAGRMTVEMRSVNSRFTDLQFRVADDLRAIEPLLREQIGAVVSRGKVECRVQVRASESASSGIHVDESLIQSLAGADARIRALAPNAAPMSVADYLRWQTASEAAAGAVDSVYPADQVWPSLLPVVTQVLEEFVASREREGVRLAATIARLVGEMKVVVQRLEPLVPELLASAEARLKARIEEAMPQAAAAIPAEETFARIRQEVALLGLRADVAEEFERLNIHMGEVLRTLDAGGPSGKRLDFLTQELNREANTLASKAGGIVVTDGAVALKLLIEQVREQVQNLE